MRISHIIYPKMYGCASQNSNFYNKNNILDYNFAICIFINLHRFIHFD